MYTGSIPALASTLTSTAHFTDSARTTGLNQVGINQVYPANLFPRPARVARTPSDTFKPPFMLQWLVPSEKVILFQTLYLPEGLRIGRRFTSSSVAAS